MGIGRKIRGEVSFDVASAQVQRGLPLLADFTGKERAFLQQKESPDPRQAAIANFEAACPVDSDGIRIFFLPVRPLGENLPRKLVVTGEPIGLRQRDKVLMAAQLPSNL